MVGVVATFIIPILIYMVALVVKDGYSLMWIVLFSLIFITFFGANVKKPEYTLYLFLLIELFFPKSGNDFKIIKIQELEGITLFSIVETILMLTICVQLALNRDIKFIIPKKIYRISLVVIIIFIINLIFNIVRNYDKSSLNFVVNPEELVWNVKLLHGLIFFWGCFAFVREVKQIEKMFIILMISGVALIIESLVVSYFNLNISLFVAYSKNFQGRFNSIFFFDFIRLSLICLTCVAINIYFADKKKSLLLYSFVPWLMLPILATYQRAPLACVFIVLSSFWVLKIKKTIKPILKYQIALLVIFLFLPNIIGNSLEILWRGEFASVRTDFFSSLQDSWISRLGAHLRGLDVIYSTFPFGVGEGRMDKAMYSSAIKPIFSYLAIKGEMSQFYWLIASGLSQTGPHNLYINFLGEFGVLGGIVLVLIISYCRKAYREFGRVERKVFMIKITGFSALMATSFYSLFYHSTFYWLIFFQLFLLFYDVKQELKGSQ